MSPASCRLFASLLAATLVVGVLAGCSYTPRDPHTVVEVPESFSTAGSEPLPDRFWMALRDPALDALVEQALRANLDLLQAWDRLDAARALARREGAELWPELSASISAGHTFTDISASRGSAFSLGLTASWEIDIRGKQQAVRSAAESDAMASQEDVQATAISLAAAVATVWYQLLEAREQLRLLDEQIKVNEQVQELVEFRFRNGKARAQDVLRQQQFTESSRGDRIRFVHQAKLLEQQLAILLGRPPMDVVAPAPDGADGATGSKLINLPPLPATGLPVELVTRRPDVRAAFHDVDAANHRVASAIADQFPQFSIGVSARTSGDNVGDLFGNWLLNLVANLVGPILDAGRRAAEVDRTKAVASEAVHAYGAAMLDAFGEVESALTRETQQREFLQSLDEQIRLATLALERAREAFANGVSDFINVLDLLRTQQGLMRSRLTAQRDLIQARIDLCSALAGGWELARPGDDARQPEEGP